MDAESMGLRANDLANILEVVPYNAQRDGEYDAEDARFHLVVSHRLLKNPSRALHLTANSSTREDSMH